MNIGQWVEAWEKRVPLDLQESWDHSGLQWGRRDKTLQGVVATLDLGQEAVDEAEERGANLIVTHHPALFNEMHHMEESYYLHDLIMRCMESGIAVYSSHTPFDFVDTGVNHVLAEKAGIPSSEILPLRAYEAERGAKVHPFSQGMGTMGSLPHPKKLSDFASDLSKALLSHGVVYYGNPNQEVSQIGFLGGGGMEFAEDALRAGCDAFVSADVSYHAARDWVLRGLAIVDAGHYQSERPALERFIEISQEIAPDVEHSVCDNGEESIRRFAQ